MKDQLLYALAAGGQLRCTAAVTTLLVSEACRRHRAFPTASAALGRALTGGLLMGAGAKDLEKITIHFHCNGPVGNIIVQADPQGRVRGYVSNPAADSINGNSRGKLDVRAIVGGGMLHVFRDAGFEIGLMKEPYRGMVPIVSGEIGEDIAYYLAKSEQINSAVGLGVMVEFEDGTREDALSSIEAALERMRIRAAGGFIIQVMPSAEENLISQIEQNISEAPTSTEMIRSGMTPFEMLKELVGDLDLVLLEEKEPRFACQCSDERARQIIAALGREEIEDMIAKDGGAELTCHFCNATYKISRADLEKMLEEEGEAEESDSITVS
ncbi:MAG: Hsp33 family molecular chaperone HslO [Acidobacteriota bacterium]